ncbi:MAG: hypothetical protein ACR2MD_19070 [Aridibacter sp.]
MKIYKVISVKQKSLLRGYLSSSGLQNKINEWSYLGWSLDRIVGSETFGLSGTKDVFFIIFVKEAKIPKGLQIKLENQTDPKFITEKEITELVRSRLISPAMASKIPDSEHWKPLIQNFPEIVDLIEFHFSGK